MKERSELIAWIRGEIVGPSFWLAEPERAAFSGPVYNDNSSQRRGSLVWLPAGEQELQEVLYYDRETPHRKYGAGLLHPGALSIAESSPDVSAAEASDSMGSDSTDEDATDAGPDDTDTLGGAEEGNSDDDFEVTSTDIRHPSTLGISICAKIAASDRIVVRLPRSRHLHWQEDGDREFGLNGRYERCTRHWTSEKGKSFDDPAWRRIPAVLQDCAVHFDGAELSSGTVVRKNIAMPQGSPIALSVDVFPRKLKGTADGWLLTVVLRNTSSSATGHEAILYQTYFEVSLQGGELRPYPESVRPFAQLDPDEKSLALLYKESRTWGIGHGCSAGWDAEPGEKPGIVYADVMPAVQTPSMTPDIRDRDGNAIKLSMRALAGLPDDGNGPEWHAIENIAREYHAWIEARRVSAATLTPELREVATGHLDRCASCLARINDGIELLKGNVRVRKAFRFANLSMLLQQIATKVVTRRSLVWSGEHRRVQPGGEYKSPWQIFVNRSEGEGVGSWRAFQIAFLLMSLRGVCDGSSPDREIVDLIWFPTGGGKTEAYLGVMAFYVVYQRLLMSDDPSSGLRRDGTNALMRYTLRMLTTQQFQRASSLVCALEVLRRRPATHGLGEIPGARISIGLWIGGDGSPNRIADAKTEMNRFRNKKSDGNPLVLTECPWCRSEIGRYDGPRPGNIREAQWKTMSVRGVDDTPEGPRLHCTDPHCEFGSEDQSSWLPVEVIDERIYRFPPSIVIATADKLAMMAYRPDCGAIFGRTVINGQRTWSHMPPGLIVQDELHLISGPLGTMYGLYEVVFERLCSHEKDGKIVRPKLIASTATIRGADEQVRALYARSDMRLFPSPGLDIGDSLFGVHARNGSGKLSDGRLYLGVHANDYGSILTTQVRTFSAALFRPFAMPPAARDPWWSLLVFYNSIRELGGARTLFDSDIRSRLKFVFNRENFGADRRNMRIVEELTSRLSQAEIVGMLDGLATRYSESGGRCFDACLASNIIEVGVDIDRLSLMGVVGQPKTTAQYIQVTGRIGRRWWERPGLVLMLYNPSKSRDRSHFEQFHSYHRRLYERVEPTSATPFALSAIERALPGALLAWARQQSSASVREANAYADAIESGIRMIRERCEFVQEEAGDRARSLAEIESARDELVRKWGFHPQLWEDFPQRVDGEYLMLWPGQFATQVQKDRGVVVASSMRQVDRSAELMISPDN
jgi:hypothetical protein